MDPRRHLEEKATSRRMEEAFGLPPLAAHGAPIDPALAVNAANRAARVSAYQQQMRQQQQYPYASGTQEKKPDISSLDATLWNQPHTRARRIPCCVGGPL